jgi:hypothetical protein
MHAHRVSSVLACIFFATVAQPQCSRGLHAAVTAQFVPSREGFSQEAHVQLSFILLNDSDRPIDVKASTWKIAVDGGELPDSDSIFGNGPHPTGGYKTLNPGESYQFGYALPVRKYFPYSGKYKVAWKGSDFESSTIELNVPMNVGSSRLPEKSNRQ